MDGPAAGALAQSAGCADARTAASGNTACISTTAISMCRIMAAVCAATG
jgi:hypothetical protein